MWPDYVVISRYSLVLFKHGCMFPKVYKEQSAF